MCQHGKWDLLIWWLLPPFNIFSFLSLILAPSGTQYFYQLQCSSYEERQHVFLRWRQQTEVHHYFQNAPFTFKTTPDTRNTRHSFCLSSHLAMSPPPPPPPPVARGKWEHTESKKKEKEVQVTHMGPFSVKCSWYFHSLGGTVICQPYILQWLSPKDAFTVYK